MMNDPMVDAADRMIQQQEAEMMSEIAWWQSNKERVYSLVSDMLRNPQLVEYIPNGVTVERLVTAAVLIVQKIESKAQDPYL